MLHALLPRTRTPRACSHVCASVALPNGYDMSVCNAARVLYGRSLHPGFKARCSMHATRMLSGAVFSSSLATAAFRTAPCVLISTVRIPGLLGHKVLIRLVWVVAKCLHPPPCCHLPCWCTRTPSCQVCGPLARRPLLRCTDPFHGCSQRQEMA